MSKLRVVSGMRPTGKLHLGHLVGALKNWAALQEQHDCFYFVADWHALTSEFANTRRTSPRTPSTTSPTGSRPASIRSAARSSCSRWCPSTPSLRRCSRWSCRFGWLERVPTYKEQREQITDKDLSNLGFLAYPLLQTADVAMYDGRFVPVGEDQVAHLELSREASAASTSSTARCWSSRSRC